MSVQILRPDSRLTVLGPIGTSMEVLRHDELAFGIDAEEVVVDHPPPRAAPKPLPEGYPPAPIIKDRSRASAIVAGPRHLTGSAVVSLIDLKLTLGRFATVRRRSHVQASQPHANA